MSQQSFKKRIDNYPKNIATTDNIAKNSGHSFRRGGPAMSALNGVQDCQIKAHGRWTSHIYTRYTAVQMKEAGEKVTKRI